MRTRAEVSDAELRAHLTHLDRMQVWLFGRWLLPVWPLVLFATVVPPALVGWHVGSRWYGYLGGLLAAVVAVAASTLWMEGRANARVVPRGLLPRRRRLERLRLDRCLDLALLSRSIAEANRSFAVSEPRSPERPAIEARLSSWHEKLGEAERDLDGLEDELAARYGDWRCFLEPRGPAAGSRTQTTNSATSIGGDGDRTGEEER